MLNLVELYTDAKIDFESFIFQVFNGINDITNSDIQKSMIKIKKQEESTIAKNDVSGDMTDSMNLHDNTSFEIKEINSSQASHKFNYVTNSETNENSDNSKSASGSNTFKEYILDKSLRKSCKHDIPIGRVRCKKGLCKQPTINYICLKNQQSTADVDRHIEMRGACGSYLNDYECRRSSIKFSV